MFWYFGKSKKKPKGLALSLSKGFTLLELIVVIAIFLIITAVVMTDIPNFREKSTLDLTANEVATYIRGAQVYGAAQVGVTEGSSSISYGVHFQKNNPRFFLFKDMDQSALVESPYQLNGLNLVGIMVRDNNNAFNCTYSDIDIVYKSNPYTQNIGTVLEAEVYSSDYSEDSPIPNVDYVDLKIQGLRNSTFESCVRVYHNGQITNTDCKTDSFDQCTSAK